MSDRRSTSSSSALLSCGRLQRFAPVLVAGPGDAASERSPLRRRV